MEKETNNLQKEAKTYLDSMRGEPPRQYRSATKLTNAAMASAQTRIAETVALFYTADRTSDVRHTTTLISQHRR